MRDNRVIAFSSQDGHDAVYCCVELDSADQGDALANREILGDGVYEVRSVDADRDKDVQGRDLGDSYWDETAVGVMNQKIAAKRSCCEVIDAARTISHIAHDQCGYAGAELREDV